MSLRALQGLMTDAEKYAQTFRESDWFDPIQKSLDKARGYWEMGSQSDCINSLDEVKFRISNFIEAWTRSLGYADDGSEEERES